MSAIDRLTYRLSQSARVAWYLGHYVAAERLQRRLGLDAPKSGGSGPTRADILKDLGALFETDWRNIEAGIYSMPGDVWASPFRLLARSRQFFADVPRVARRRAARNAGEVRSRAGGVRYPAYYLQNFHFQTDGYLSPRSAALYDFQVETLFSGGADAMRRQALVPLRTALAGRDQRTVSLLDVACGTGRFLRFVKDTYPRLPVAGLDLSTDYIDLARRALKRRHGVDFVRADASSMPLPDGSQDIVTCIFLFHELPPAVRVSVAKEIARVLKPDGRLIFVDSLQFGDVPAYDPLLERFPESFHEPYYLSYARSDLSALFAEPGLRLMETRIAFLSKVCVFVKP